MNKHLSFMKSLKSIHIIAFIIMSLIISFFTLGLLYYTPFYTFTYWQRVLVLIPFNYGCMKMGGNIMLFIITTFDD